MVLASCSKTENQYNLAPEISYNSELSATFFTEGNSSVPNVNWNGSVGQFGLKKAVKEVSIDSDTGVISWSKKLSLGNNPITLLVFNNGGITSVEINLENEFEGKFMGTHGFSDPKQVEIDFKSDGTSSLIYDGSTSVEEESSLIENEIKVRFENEEKIYIIEGLVEYSQDKALIDGTIFIIIQGASKGIRSSLSVELTAP